MTKILTYFILPYDENLFIVMIPLCADVLCASPVGCLLVAAIAPSTAKIVKNHLSVF